MDRSARPRWWLVGLTSVAMVLCLWVLLSLGIGMAWQMAALFVLLVAMVRWIGGSISGKRRARAAPERPIGTPAGRPSEAGCSSRRRTPRSGSPAAQPGCEEPFLSTNWKIAAAARASATSAKE